MIESTHIKHVLEHKSVVVARNNQVININEEMNETDILLLEPSKSSF